MRFGRLLPFLLPLAAACGTPAPAKAPEENAPPQGHAAAQPAAPAATTAPPPEAAVTPQPPPQEPPRERLSCRRMCELAHDSCTPMPVDGCTSDCEAGPPAGDRCGGALVKLLECMRERPRFECNDRGLPEPIECAGRVLALQDCQMSPEGWQRVVHPASYFSVLMPPQVEAMKAGDGIGFAGVEGDVSFTVIEIPIERAKALLDRPLYVASIARTFADKCAAGTRVPAGTPSEDGISTTFQTQCSDGSTATGYVVQAPEAQTEDTLLFHALVVRGKDVGPRAALFINSFRVHPPLTMTVPSRENGPAQGKPRDATKRPAPH